MNGAIDPIAILAFRIRNPAINCEGTKDRIPYLGDICRVHPFRTDSSEIEGFVLTWLCPQSGAISLSGGRIVTLSQQLAAYRSRLLALGVSFSATLFAQSAAAQELADPQGSGVVVSAVQWLQGTLLGTVATLVAVIAVASVGLMMLTGRINWRYGATVILGCFILFGAASIVGGIQSTAQLAQ